MELGRFVERVSVVTPARGRARRVDRLPDGRAALVVRVLESGRGDLMVVGPRTRALLKDAVGFERALAIQFKPGWVTPLLGIAASEIGDQYLLLEDLWGSAARDLAFDLLSVTTGEEMVERVSRAWALRKNPWFEPTSARLARQAVRLLGNEETRVESVAEKLGVSSRHLRRAFVENLGIGPKDYARSVRLQRALQLTSVTEDWARIASEAGYYDQSHLIAEFRDLIGLTPSAFLERTKEKDPLPSPLPLLSYAREGGLREAPIDAAFSPA